MFLQWGKFFSSAFKLIRLHQHVLLELLSAGRLCNNQFLQDLSMADGIQIGLMLSSALNAVSRDLYWKLLHLIVNRRLVVKKKTFWLNKFRSVAKIDLLLWGPCLLHNTFLWIFIIPILDIYSPDVDMQYFILWHHQMISPNNYGVCLIIFISIINFLDTQISKNLYMYLNIKFSTRLWISIILLLDIKYSVWVLNINNSSYLTFNLHSHRSRWPLGLRIHWYPNTEFWISGKS